MSKLKENEKKFNDFVIQELNVNNIPVPSIEDYMKEYDLTEEDWGDGDDYPALLVNALLEGAQINGAKFNNKKIIDIINDAGNLSVITEDGEDYPIYDGFEYTSYSYNNKYLDDAINEIKKIQWK